MPDANDMDLVREFARDNSEAAFTELVRRHINLVYSVARRCTGNDGDAHDVTQAVFIILARKAAGLREKTLLTGWLYETTRFAAARLLRTNARRHAREQEAYMQSTLNEADHAAVWEKLSPHLETAMGKLNAADRALLVLRFYENKSGPEAAALLGIREDAAHKRVARAIEKLRKFFAQRGVTLSGAAIAGAVSANSVQAAPAGLAAIISAMALSGTTITTAAVVAATKTMTIFQKIITSGAIATAVGVIIYAFHLQNQIQGLQQQQSSLLEKNQQLQQERDGAINQLATLADENASLKRNETELLRLRAEVTRLHNQHGNSAMTKTNDAPVNLIQIHIKSRFVSIPAGDEQNMGVQWTKIAQDGEMGFLDPSQLKNILDALNGASDVTVLSAPQTVSMNGQQVQMSVTKSFQLSDMTWTNLGEIFKATPYFSTNSSTFNLNFDAELKQLVGDPSQATVQTVEITNQVVFASGKTLVIEHPIPTGSWSPDLTNEPAGPRNLLLFVTATPVDERDNLLNFPPSNQ